MFELSGWDWLKFGKKNIVGLDIGSSSIKAVELERSHGEVVISQLALEALANDIVVDSMIVDSGTVASAISKVLSEHNFTSKQVATAVSGHSVIVKRITMQTLDEPELGEAVRSEAAQYIPFDMNDVNMDYQVLSEDWDGPTLDILLTAVKKDKILNYTSALQLSGHQPAIVDIDAFALQNCYEFNYDPAPTSTVALLNLGASVMNINIVRGNLPLFTRDVSVGGNQYTDSLQKDLNLAFEDAEALKLGKKVSSLSDETKLPILQQVTEIIVLEIQKTFDFFRASAEGEHIERIYLAGGSAQVQGLMEALRQEFSIPVEMLNPFLRIVPPIGEGAELIDRNAAQFVVAVGLALRSLDKL